MERILCLPSHVGALEDSTQTSRPRLKPLTRALAVSALATFYGGLPSVVMASLSSTAGGGVSPDRPPTTSILAAAGEPSAVSAVGRNASVGAVAADGTAAEGTATEQAIVGPTLERMADGLLVRRDCPSKGPAHQIVIPRSSEWVHPNSSFRLLPSVVDAKGCLVARGSFTYAIETKTNAMTVGRNSGVVKVANDAPEGRYTIVVRSGALSATTTVSVVNRDKLAALLERPVVNVELEETPSDARPTVREVWGTAPAKAADFATPRKWWFVGLTGLVTLGLGLLGLRLLRAGSRPTTPPAQTKRVVGGTAPTIRSVTPPTNGLGNPPPKPTPVSDVGDRGRLMPVGLRCPRCGVLYTDGSLFCGTDGTKLLRAGENSSNEKLA